MQYVTMHLLVSALNRRKTGKERKPIGNGISKLNRKDCGIYGRNVYSRRSTCLHAAGDKAPFDQLFGQTVRCLFPDSSSIHLTTSDENLPSEEGSSGQDKRPRVKNSTCKCANSADL